jgi:hypothetical protein
MLTARAERPASSPRPAPISLPAQMPSYGVALFDNPRDMSAGWACRAGGDSFRVNSVAELSNGTVWVTNLEFMEYNDRAKRLSHLRRVDYLRSSLSAFGADLGMRTTGMYAQEAAPVLAGVIERAVHMAVRAYGWQSPVNDAREDVLYEDIRRTLPGMPKPQASTRSAFASAYQAYSVPGWGPEYEDNLVIVTLRYNRLEYAQKIMATLVPDDAWTYIPPEQASQLTIEQLLDPACPTLVEAAVELDSIDPEIAVLVAFGASMSKRNGLRKWISQPELAWLSRHARVQVTSALRCRSAVPLPESVRLPHFLTDDPLMSLSMSAGLLAESHWAAITQPVYNRTLRCDDVHAWSVWLRAVDRALTFSLALKAHQAGFRVQGYGNGSVQIRLQKPRLREALAFAENNGCAHPCFDPIFQEHGIV